MPPRRTPPPLAIATAAALALLASADPAGAADGSGLDAAAEQRIQRLEEHLQSVVEEITRLKEEVARAREAERAGRQELERVQGEVVRAQASAAQAAERAAQAGTQATQASTQAAEAGARAAAADAQARESVTRANTAVAATSEAFVRTGPGVVLEDPKGRWRLQPSVKVQADYRSFAPDYTSADGFLIRRARLGLGGTFFGDYTVYLEEDFANQNTNPSVSNPTPITTYAYAEYGGNPALHLRVGQFKPYFGFENTVQDMNVDFLERGLEQSLLSNLTYDRGLMLFGAPPVHGLYYSVALTNGTGQGVDRPQGNLQETEAGGHELTVRLAENFAALLGRDDTLLHLGTSAKRGAAVNSAANPYRAATVQTEARGLNFFIPATFNGAGASPSVSNIERTLANVETILAQGPFKLQAEYTQARYDGTSAAPGQPADFSRLLKAGYVEAGWNLTGEHYADFYRDSVLGRPVPTVNFDPAQGHWGLWELDTRYSWFNGTEFAAANPLNTGRPGTSASYPQITQGTDAAHAYTAGLKWMPNPNARVLLNWVRTNFRTPVTVNGHATDYENALETRFQLDF